jgi:hypothetical protein
MRKKYINNTLKYIVVDVEALDHEYLYKFQEGKFIGMKTGDIEERED